MAFVCVSARAPWGAAFAALLVACSAPTEGWSARTELEGTHVNVATPPPVAPVNARIVEAPKELPVQTGPCPSEMAPVEGRFCIDRWEASLIEMLPTGEERPFSPFSTLDGRKVRAVSAPKVFPQAYISEVDAGRACSASGKRLCKVNEWKTACRGPERRAFGYGDRREPGRCNDHGRNPVVALFGYRFTWNNMNQPSLNQLDNTLAPTGAHEGCTNGYGVFDMVGNLHEWVADPSGTFYGGYYQDTTSHGNGCAYLTTAHSARYHDYSTGFRCCADQPFEPAPRGDLARRTAPTVSSKVASRAVP